MPRLKGSTLVFLCAALVAVFALSLTPEAAAQCAMCRAALEGGGEKTARTMNFAILVLLVPPVAIFCTFFAVAVKGARKGEDGEED